MFIDEATIKVQAGHGGNGCASLYKDKYCRRGRPDGGDGGNGGAVIVVADKKLSTLIDFKYKSQFKAKSGAHGSSNTKKGRNGEDCVIRVPCGTILKDLNSSLIIRDLQEDAETVLVAKGGAYGLGNVHRRESTFGEQGEQREIHLELRIIADIGIVGFPNSGKSTLLTKLTNSRAKIANYPFTTKDPALGILKLDDEIRVVIAEIPGIIKGAHEGRGLGDRFLKHTGRTRLLVHLVDIAAVDGRDPVEDFNVFNNELKLYSKELAKKPKIVVANKIDIKDSEKNLKKFRKCVKEKIIAISAYKDEGLGELKNAIRKNVQKDCY